MQRIRNHQTLKVCTHTYIHSLSWQVVASSKRPFQNLNLNLSLITQIMFLLKKSCLVCHMYNICFKISYYFTKYIFSLNFELEIPYLEMFILLLFFVDFLWYLHEFDFFFCFSDVLQIEIGNFFLIFFFCKCIT